MFYSSEILSLKSDSKLGVIWLAATVGPKAGARKLHRKELLSVDIPETCRYLRDPPEPLSLRLSANMMVGVTRVYGQQCQYQYSDVQGLLQRLVQLDAPQSNDLDLKPVEKTATNNNNNITLKKIECISAVNADLKLPDFDLNELLQAGTNMNRGSLSSHTTPSLSHSSTPEQGRRGWSSSSPSVTGNDNYLVPFSDALTDFEPLIISGSSSEPDHFQSFLRPPSTLDSSASESLNLSSELLPFPAAFTDSSKPAKKRKLLHLFDDRIVLDKDELFIRNSDLDAPLSTRPRASSKNPRQEALDLLTGANDWLPEDFTRVLKDRFVPEIETFRAEPIGETFDDLSMQMPWQSSTDNDDDLRRLSMSSSTTTAPTGLVSPFMNLSSTASPFSTPSPKISPTGRLLGGLQITPSTTTKSTLDFLLFLQERIAPGATVPFATLIEPPKRAIAARAFHHVLELRMTNLLQVRQMRSFSAISIKLSE